MKILKIVITALVVSILLHSCKKDEIIEVKAKLLPSEIIGLTENTKEIITYNADNMITRYESADYEYNDSEVYNIEYANKKPVRVSDNFTGDVLTYNITYSNDGKYVYLTDTRNATKEIAPNFKLTLDGSGDLTNLFVDNHDDASNYEMTYGYDVQNNWTTFPWGGRIIEYDLTKRGIFTNSSTPTWLPTYYTWFERGVFSPNLIVKSKGDSDTSRVYTYVWSEYNEDGYPEKLTLTLSNYDVPFEYQIKYVEAK